MPLDTALCTKQYIRYAWCRDNGHAKYVEKAEQCDAFFRGDQWSLQDRKALEAVRRPALTINKIISTVSNVMGEQIYNRSEISFRPRSGAPAETADTLSKVFKQISDNNQLDWKRSDMFADGIITSRGFLDVRMDNDDSMTGEIRIENVNPKNVIIDPDGEEYDPDSWSEVFITKWLTADDIAILYNKEDAEFLRNREQSFFPYGYDSIQAYRDRFGDRFNPMYNGDYDQSQVMRNIRIIDRQHRMLDRQKHFVDPNTGDMRPIPDNFDRDRIANIVQTYGLQVTSKLVRRIRWTVIADNVRLHDDWSPYKHFTVVPYFPYFRRGTTIGLVENLIGSQELLNKVSSQELHVVNTTANSGYKVRAGALSNMTVEELERKGAQTGLVIEVNGDPDKDVQKISPNQVPQGLDRISYKAEEHIKTISGVSDSMQGMDREDVAAKAIQEKKKSGATGLAKPLDSLTRSDFILARNILDLVQEFYTEPRLMTITHDQMTGESENFQVNQPTPEGTIINDLTLGEYDVVVSSVPRRETLEDSQFDQAVSLKQLGIAIPDSVLIDASRLMNKKEILKLIDGDQQSPEFQQQQQLKQRGAEAQVSKLEGEAADKHAAAQLKQVNAQAIAQGEPDDGSAQAKMHEAQTKQAVAQHEATLKERQFQNDAQMKMMDLGLKREGMNIDAQLKAEDLAQKREQMRVQAAQQAAAAAQAPRAAPK